MKMLTTAVVYLLLAVLFAAFCLSAIELWHPGYSWHDQQRIYQLLLLAGCVPLAGLLPQVALPRPALLLLAGLLFLGACSSILAPWSQWAFKEWSRYAGLMLLALLVGGLAARPVWRSAILWAMVAVGFIQAYQFLVCYLTAFVTGMRLLDAGILFNGFSNPRFFGQFQVMLMPVMALLVEFCWRQRRVALAVLLALALVSQWCISFTLGGRGLWLGLLVGHFTLLLVNRQLWRVFALQVSVALLGFSLFFLLFKLIPLLLGIDPILHDGLRVGLSDREYIWQWAWEMALANPLLGVGPMHYSAIYNPIAAHPHQVILQWLAEWGFIATFIAVAVGVWGMSHAARCLRQTSANEIDAGLWVAIVGALILAQIDGVFVMPYTETWLALLIGLALARWAKPVPHLPAQRFGSIILAIPVLVVLANVLVNEAPVLPRAIDAYIAEHDIDRAPRFWSQGWIPMGFNRGMAD